MINSSIDNNKKVLEALRVVNELVEAEDQASDYFYGGGADTWMYALEVVVRKNGQDINSISIKEYAEMNKDAIDKKYYELLKKGEELGEFYSKVKSFLNEQIKIWQHEQ